MPYYHDCHKKRIVLKKARVKEKRSVSILVTIMPAKIA